MPIVSGGSGGGGSGNTVGVLLFDSTLGADAASIDTGANGIAGTAQLIEVFILARTSEAAQLSGVNVTVNNDTGANYDTELVSGSDATAGAAAALAAANWNLTVAGNTATAGCASVITITIPAYVQTTFQKAGVAMQSFLDGGTAQRIRAHALRWRNTAAITRMAVAAQSGVLRAGSRLTVYGRTLA